MLSAVNTLDHVIAVPHGAPVTLHGFAGSAESATDFSEQTVVLAPGAASPLEMHQHLQPFVQHMFIFVCRHTCCHCEPREEPQRFLGG